MITKTMSETAKIMSRKPLKSKDLVAIAALLIFAWVVM